MLANEMESVLFIYQNYFETEIISFITVTKELIQLTVNF